MLSAVGRLDMFRGILAVCLESSYEMHLSSYRLV